MKNYFLLIIIMFFGMVTYSQNSLEIEEINTYYKIGLDFIDRKKFESAFENFNLGFQKSQDIKDKNLIGYGYLYLAKYHHRKKEYTKSIELAKSSLSIFKELNEELGMAECYHLIGRVYYGLSQYEKSLENYFKALNIYEHRKDEVKIALNLSKIAGVYLLTADFIKARENLERVIIIYKKTNDEQGVLSSITDLGVSYQKEGNLNKAIEIYKVSLSKSRELGEERIESILLGNIGSSYRRLGNYKESLNYLFKALDLKIELKDYSSAAHTYNDISETYIEMKNLIKAKEYALKAIQFSKGYSLHQERYAHFILSNIEYDLGNYKSSINNLKAFQKLEDSIFSIDKIAKINGLRIQYETEKKQLKIEAQESNIVLLAFKNKVKGQWLLFGGLGLFSIFTFIILFKSRNTARKENLLQEKFSQDLLLSQEAERTKIARELHDSVGQQLTLIKRKAQNEGDDVIAKMTNNALEEVRSISRDLYPALLKELGLKDSIEQLINEYDEQTDLFFSMDIDDIDAYFTENTSLNFYRLVQECLTNILKHAKAKTVTVSIKKEENKIITLISDNGKGFDVNDNKKKNSLGLKTIFERIKIMNGKLSIDSKLDIGTSFIFSIPIKNE